jgi:hypothetical protein
VFIIATDKQQPHGRGGTKFAARSSQSIDRPREAKRLTRAAAQESRRPTPQLSHNGKFGSFGDSENPDLLVLVSGGNQCPQL